MNIIIGGDSYGCGEWGCTICDAVEKNGHGCTQNCTGDSFGAYGVRHSGLEHYLQQAGHNVLNASIPGSSITESIASIATCIAEADDSIDMVFWFQTHPTRDTQMFNRCLSIDDYYQQCNEVVHTGYQLLSELEVEAVYVFGGVSRASQDIAEHKIDGVTVLIESLIEWLTDAEISQPEYMYLPKFIERMYDVKTPDEIIHELIDLAESYDQLVGLSETGMIYFRPDDAHLNRHSYKILFDYLNVDLNLFNE